MILVTKKDILLKLPEKFKSRYNFKFKFFDGRMSDNIIKQLELETDLTEKRAIEIIGNNSWTSNNCYQCGEDVYSTIQLSDNPDHDNITFKVCLDCLKKAVVLLEEDINKQ